MLTLAVRSSPRYQATVILRNDLEAFVFWTPKLSARHSRTVWSHVREGPCDTVAGCEGNLRARKGTRVERRASADRPTSITTAQSVIRAAELDQG